MTPFREVPGMDYVVLALALPLFVVALWVTFRPRQAPAAAVPAAAPEATAVAHPVSAPVAADWAVRRLLPWLIVAGIALAAFLFLSPDEFLRNLLRLVTLSRYGLR